MLSMLIIAILIIYILIVTINYKSYKDSSEFVIIKQQNKIKELQKIIDKNTT